MRNVIVGCGEVGQGLHKVIGGDVHDPIKDMVAKGECDILHICIPYFEGFELQVKAYQDEFNPKYTCIHSTVQVGTSEKLKACHSPIRGVHPNLDEGIKTFTKYVAGEGAYKIAEELELHGVKTKVLENSRDTEAGKLWSTTQYGFFIVMNKMIKRWCDENGVDFEIAYTDFNRTYNEGYRKLKRDEVVRPFLQYMEGKIGGHCVIPNCEILDSDFAKMINEYNKLF